MLKSGPCCCMSLRTAGVVIGILEIVFWTTNVAVSANLMFLDLYLNHGNFHSDTATTEVLQDKESNDSAMVEDNYESMEDEEEEENVLDIIMTVHLVLALNCVLSLFRIINGCVLIFGILKTNHVMVKCSFVVHSLVLILTFSLLILAFVKGGSSVGSIICYAASFAGSLYLLWVVFELMAEMKSSTIMPRIPKPKI